MSPWHNSECLQLGMSYVPLDELLAASDIVTLHCPLTPQTRHLISSESLERLKRGVMLINTSRGAVIDTKAVIEGLKRHSRHSRLRGNDGLARVTRRWVPPPSNDGAAGMRERRWTMTLPVLPPDREIPVSPA